MQSNVDNRFERGCRQLVVWLLAAIVLPAVLARAAPLTPAQSRSSWFVDMSRFGQGAHGNLKCEDCHGSMPGHGQMKPQPSDPQTLKQLATDAFDYGRCQRCHALAVERSLVGGHAKAMAARKASPDPAARPAPTCGHCHNAHYDKAHLERTQIGRRQVETCGTCHPAHAASYGADIHGRLAVALETKAAAYCTDCHGAHSVAGLKQAEEARQACRRCHADASVSFAGYVVHSGVVAAKDPGPKDQSVVWLDRLQLAMMAVVGLSLLFFVVQAGLWLLREVHERVSR